MQTPLALLAAPILLAFAGDPPAVELEAPVRLSAADGLIDSEIGHAAPCVVDWDADGKPDLLVGQFGGGILRVFRNEGTAAEPRLAAGVRFQAAGKDGTVPTG